MVELIGDRINRLEREKQVLSRQYRAHSATGRDTNPLRDRLVELIDEIYNLRRQLPEIIEISEVEVEDNSPTAWRSRLSRASE